VLSKLTLGTRVRGCTEHKRHDKLLFHAHPSYRGHNQWHDWATFDWSGGNIEQDDDRVCIPGQIVFFLVVTEEMVGIDESTVLSHGEACENTRQTRLSIKTERYLVGLLVRVRFCTFKRF
jgi:hypothetical protein